MIPTEGDIRPQPELLARAAGPGAGGIAALDHEIRDDPVERNPVVEAGVGELLEVRHGLGGFLVEEVDRDRALGGLENGLLAHGFLPKMRRPEI